LKDIQDQGIQLKSLEYASENRYGGVVFQFPIDATRLKSDRRAFVFGTRQYTYEYSQVLLIPEKESPLEFYGYDPDKACAQNNDINGAHIKLHALEKIINIQEFHWPLKYGIQEWTHPELAFAEVLDIELSKLRIYFVNHTSYNCLPSKRGGCADCSAGVTGEMDTLKRFNKELSADELRNLKSKMEWHDDGKFYSFST